jgi:hypothetical protein
MEGGHYDKYIEIEIIESVGDWIIEPKGLHIILKPDSSIQIKFRFIVPEDSQEGDLYFIKYEIKGDYESGEKENRVSALKNFGEALGYHGCPRWDSQDGSDFIVYREFIGPLATIIMSSIALYRIIKKNKKSNQIPKE